MDCPYYEVDYCECRDCCECKTYHNLQEEQEVDDDDV